ncbi:hypothetical protein ACRRTK_023381 [Alexandromys fortis]
MRVQKEDGRLSTSSKRDPGGKKQAPESLQSVLGHSAFNTATESASFVHATHSGVRKVS